MSRWTDEELRELVTLWPTNSASQIGKRLHRLRSAIRRKAMRLRQVGLLPPGLPKHFDVNPRKAAAAEAETKRSRRHPSTTTRSDSFFRKGDILARGRSSRTSRARPAANALHEKHFRRVRRDVEPLVADLAENVPADADARFVVETIGVAIRALFDVERIHNAHTVRMILRNIFDHSGNITQIAKPQKATHQASQSQMRTSSRFRFIVGAAG